MKDFLNYVMVWILGVFGLSASMYAATCSPSLLGAPCHEYHHSSDDTLAGNPINLATGNKYQDEVDLFPLRGGLELVRYYNSLDREVGALGRSWKWSYEERLHRLQTAYPQLLYADGQRIRFTPLTGRENWFHQIRGGHELVYLPQQRIWVLVSPIIGSDWAWRRVFDEQGYLQRLAIIARLGDSHTAEAMILAKPISELVLERMPHTGRLLAVYRTDLPAQRLDYEYDERGRNIAVRTPVGRFELTFDRQHQTLLQVLRPDQLGLAYRYDEWGYLTHRALIHAKEAWTVPLGAWQYMSDGRVKHYAGALEQFSIRYEGMRTEVLTAKGEHSDYEFAPYEGRFQLVKVGGTPCQTCPKGVGIHQVQHNETLSVQLRDQLSSELAWSKPMLSEDLERRILHWQYRNGLEFFIRGDERWVVDKAGRLLWHTALRRDEQGRVIQVLQAFPFLSKWLDLSLSYDASGRLKSAQDERGTHHYSWTAQGQQLPFDRGGFELRFTPSGQLAEVAAHSGRLIARYDYHNKQRTRKTVYAEDGQQIRYERYFVYEDYRLRYERTYRPNTPDQIRIYHYDDRHLIGFTELNEQGSQHYFVQTNHLGAPVLVSDETGTVVWLAVYDALAKAHLLEEKITFNLRLPGQYADEESTWYDNQYRTYLPDKGAFLQADPMGARLGASAYGFADYYHGYRIDPWGLYLIAFDGTSMQPKNASNIYQLSQRYQGVSRYYSGIGTYASSALKRTFNMMIGGGGSAILDRAFSDLMASLPKVGEDGRLPMLTLDLIGFSRGAALALDFAQYLSQHLNQGVLHDDMGKPRACIQLRFVGLLDTVRQMDANRIKGEKITHQLPLSWQYIAHAVALNEHNTLFPLTKLSDRDIQAHTQLQQRGLIGAHGDIGGGRYEEDLQSQYANKRYGNLSKISQAWLQWQAQQAGVRFREADPSNWTVDNPIMHKTLLLEPSHSFARRHTYQIDSEDRAVYDRRGRYQASQGREEHLGSATRQQTDRFIHLRKGYIVDNAVGRVDMVAYKAWLKNAYNWDMEASGF